MSPYSKRLICSLSSWSAWDAIIFIHAVEQDWSYHCILGLGMWSNTDHSSIWTRTRTRTSIEQSASQSEILRRSVVIHHWKVRTRESESRRGRIEFKVSLSQIWSNLIRVNMKAQIMIIKNNFRCLHVANFEAT